MGRDDSVTGYVIREPLIVSMMIAAEQQINVRYERQQRPETKRIVFLAMFGSAITYGWSSLPLNSSFHI
jgi:hypothetical protein